jgi:hypothetical protein
MHFHNICFPKHPFPKHRRLACVVLPEGSYERNGSIKRFQESMWACAKCCFNVAAIWILGQEIFVTGHGCRSIIAKCFWGRSVNDRNFLQSVLIAVSHPSFTTRCRLSRKATMNYATQTCKLQQKTDTIQKWRTKPACGPLLCECW